MTCTCGHSEVNHFGQAGCMVMDNDFSCPCSEYAECNSVRFCLPFTPVSMNKLYEIWYSTREVKRTREYNNWRTRAKEHMPPWKLQSKDSLICVEMVFFYDFYYINGTLRKIDTHNLAKGLIDTIADRYGFRDERVKRCPIDSLPSKDERAVVIVSEYFMEEKPNEV